MDDWIKVATALVLYVIAFAISWTVVHLAYPFIGVFAFLVLSYFLFTTANKYLDIETASAELEGGILVQGIVLIISCIISALAVYMLSPVIKVITIFVLAWIIWKYLLTFSGEIANELDEYIRG